MLIIIIFLILLNNYLTANSIQDSKENIWYQPADILLQDENIRLQKQFWYWSDQSGIIWSVHIPLDKSKLSILPSTKPQTLDQFPNQSFNYAMINGGFYDKQDNPLGLVIHDFQEIQALNLNGGGSGVIYSKNDQITISHKKHYPGQAEEALQSIDRLVHNQTALLHYKPNRPLSTRSAIVLTKTEIILVLLAENRIIHGKDFNIQLGFNRNYGVPLWAFSHYLTNHLGAISALNLDGGVSSQLLVHINNKNFTIKNIGKTINAVMLSPLS